MKDEMPTAADCCSDEGNLEERDDDRPGVRLRVCRVCGRRHIEMEAEPLHVGVEPE